MINWNLFPIFTFISLIFSSFGVYFAFKGEKASKVATFYILGIISYLIFIIGLWVFLERPVIRTLGETRLMYSFFLLVIGIIVWLRTRYNFLLLFSTTLSFVFSIINIFKPEIHQKELMPALDSIWFVPHVSVYMFSYAVLACAFLLSLYGLFFDKKSNPQIIKNCDVLVYQGLALLTMGMIMGALWAKKAWGDYWSWDPKEVWASITWITGLLYIHFRLRFKKRTKISYLLIVVIFLFFQICWYGINYLPTSSQSVHTYMKN